MTRALIRAAGFMVALFGPTVLFLLLTKPVKYPNPKPPEPPDGGIPVSQK